MATATTMSEVLLVAYKLKKHSQLFNKKDRVEVMLIAGLLYIYIPTRLLLQNTTIYPCYIPPL